MADRRAARREPLAARGRRSGRQRSSRPASTLQPPERRGDTAMHLPEPIPTTVHDESFAGVTYHVRGELVPELQIEVGPASVMFEHHVLLWKQTQLNIELKKLPGAIKRKIAGLEFFVTRTSGAGRIAFSRDSPGPVRAAAPAPGRGPGRARAPVHRGDRQPRLQLRTDQGRAEHAAGRLGLLHGQVPRDRRRRAGVAARPRQRLPGGARRRRAARRGGGRRGCTRTPR